MKSELLSLYIPINTFTAPLVFKNLLLIQNFIFFIFLFLCLREKRKSCQIPVEKKKLLLAPIPTMKIVDLA